MAFKEVLMRKILMQLCLILALLLPVHGATAVEDASAAPAHTHEISGWQGNDAGTHTRFCNTYGCEYSETEDCTIFPANCVQRAFCTVCAQSIGDISPDAHEWLDSWTTSTIDGGSCHYRTCFWNEEHRTDLAPCSGGTANCRWSAECSTCHMPYGETNPNVHVWSAWKRIKVDGVDYHTRTCTWNSEHTETAACSGGEAICGKRRVCDVCGMQYGRQIEHETGDAVPYDSEHHTRRCSHPHCPEQTVYEYHSYDDPTCTKASVCQDCGAVIAPADPGLHMLAYSSMTLPGCTTAGSVNYICTNAGCSYTETAFFSGTAFGHQYNHWDPAANNSHTGVCVTCGERASVSCTPYTYDGKSVCPICGAYEGGVLPILFTSGSRRSAIVLRRSAPDYTGALPYGTLLVRGIAQPFEGILYAFTVTGSYAGLPVEPETDMTITLPVDLSALPAFRLERVNAIPAQGDVPRTETCTEIEYQLEDGELTFVTDRAGLFLLVPTK